MAEKKVTKRDNYNTILAIPAVAENANLKAFVEHEIELLDRKSATEKKPTAKQTENVGIKSALLNEMENGKLYTISEMQKDLASVAELSNQKISALLRQMIAEGTVERTEDKRKAYFSKV